MLMEVEFANKDLARLESDPAYTDNRPPQIVRKFRKTMNHLRQAVVMTDLYSMKSYHLEKLRKDRKGQHSIKLNDQFRLVLQFVDRGNQQVIRVIEIEDYH